MLSDLYIHLPFAQLEQRLPTFLAKGWQPEIAVQACDLDQFQNRDIADLASQLAKQQLRSCIHAPFFDLNPAASDADIRLITARRFIQTIDFAADIGASRIVFHPGYDPWRYARTPDTWLKNSLDFWPELIKRAASADVQLCLENIFDTSPEPLIDLLQTLNSPYLRHCFDIGHWFLFSKTPLTEWFSQLGPYLSHLHLHDNRGRRDDHLPIGSGKIDFNDFSEQLTELTTEPSATLEAHNQQDAERSLKALRQLLA